MKSSPVITTRQAADELGVSVRRIHYLVTRGELTPATRIEGLRGPLLFDRAAIAAAKKEGKK